MEMPEEQSNNKQNILMDIIQDGIFILGLGMIVAGLGIELGLGWGIAAGGIILTSFGWWLLTPPPSQMEQKSMGNK